MKKYISSLFCLLLMCCFTACVGDEGVIIGGGNGNGGGEDIPTKGLHLKVSSYYILNDGKDKAEFTVYYNGKDVTAKSEIYQLPGYELLEGNTFSTTVLGEYTFFAAYGADNSKNVKVTAISGSLDLPEDPEPEQFGGFKHRAVAFQGTATGCIYCPMMIAGLQEFYKLALSQDVLLVASHGTLGGDPMCNEHSMKLPNMQTVPFLQFNMRKGEGELLQIQPGATPLLVRDAIAYKAEQVLAEEATSGISAATLAVGELLKVTASVKVSEKAKYRVNAWVLEDNIYLDKQSNNYPELNGKYDFSIHNCVLRRIAHINNQLSGVNLGGTEVTDGNSRKEFVYEFPLKDIVIENQQNVRVLITVSKAAEGSANYTIDNAISVPLNGSQAFEYN